MNSVQSIIQLSEVPTLLEESAFCTMLKVNSEYIRSKFRPVNKTLGPHITFTQIYLLRIYFPRLREANKQRT